MHVGVDGGTNTEHMHSLPLQVKPSPVNPAMHEHSYAPSVFVQLAYSLQIFSCRSEHSSISAGNHIITMTFKAIFQLLFYYQSSFAHSHPAGIQLYKCIQSCP
jgi:hypothetical protein